MTRTFEKKAYDAIFNPRNVAIVGASNVPGKWGFIVPMNIFAGGFKGGVYLVNPREKRVLGCRAYNSLADVGHPIDLVLITVPGPLVPSVIEDCGKLGIPSAVVISAGFRETGEEGAKREAELVDRAKDLGVLFVGPNCMGIASPPVKLYAMGAAVQPPAGKFAFLSQSGNLGVQMLGWGEHEGVGFSRFVSSGNEACVGSDGFLEYFGKDDHTEVILLYLESVSHGERFFEVAREVSRRKPILVLKEGDTEAGAKAARTHSGAIAGSRAAFDSMCRQAGIVQASTTEELIDLSRSFGFLPVPKGDRVGVMTMGGGWGVVTTDQCAKEGLKLPPLGKETLDAIDPLLPGFWSRSNPVDLVGITKRSTHFSIAEALAKADEFDSVIVLGIMLGFSTSLKNAYGFLAGPWRNLRRRFGLDTFKLIEDIYNGARVSLGKVKIDDKAKSTDTKDSKISSFRMGGFDLKETREWRDELFAKRMNELIQKHKKPIVAVAFAEDMAISLFKKFHLVSTSIPEKAVRSIAKLTDYGRWLRSEKSRESIPGPEIPKPSQDLHTLMHAFGARPTEHDAKRLLISYGMPVTKQVLARDPDQAAHAAHDIGYPVAMKVMSPDIPHKTEANIVKLNVKNERELRAAYDQIMDNALIFNREAEIVGVLVEEMVGGGVEVFIGVKRDPQFGPVIMLGLGGIHVEIMKDVSMRVLPIHYEDCLEMIREIKGSVLLSGYRGSKPADREALVDTLWKTANLAMTLKDCVADLDLNPVMVLPEGKGCKIVDAMIAPIV